MTQRLLSEMLQEYCDSRGVAMQVDRHAGRIRGVKILGLESRNGRRYKLDALMAAIPLYEGAKVNVNHPKGSPHAARDYQDRLGSIRQVVLRPGEGLFGDLQFNPKHALAEQLIWDAEHAAENVGFSHNVQARTSRHTEGVLVEEILKVQSVDLVADPATTQGLFEAESSDATQDAEATPKPDSSAADTARPESASDEEEIAQEIARLQAEVQRLRQIEAIQQRRAQIQQLLAEFGFSGADAEGSGGASLGTPGLGAHGIVSALFLEQLESAPDLRQARRLIEDRARLVEELLRRNAAAQPRSREQRLVEELRSVAVGAKEWAAAIR